MESVVKKECPVVRTMLFSSPVSEKYVTKASQSEADCVVLDLEDAIPEKRKEDARKSCRAFLESPLFEQRYVMVRINPLETGTPSSTWMPWPAKT
jgi:citrate lyase subunit beta/citryl-CoA lyase